MSWKTRNSTVPIISSQLFVTNLVTNFRFVHTQFIWQNLFIHFLWKNKLLWKFKTVGYYLIRSSLWTVTNNHALNTLFQQQIILCIKFQSSFSWGIFFQAVDRTINLDFSNISDSQRKYFFYKCMLIFSRLKIV